MYPSKTALGNHIRYVHSERSFKCTLCDKAFKKPVGLKVSVVRFEVSITWFINISFCTYILGTHGTAYRRRSLPLPALSANFQVRSQYAFASQERALCIVGGEPQAATDHTNYVARSANANRIDFRPEPICTLNVGFL